MENVGIYTTIIESAAKYASPPEVCRISEIHKVLDLMPSLRDGASEPLDFSRASYAVFLLSGAILMRICGEVPGHSEVASRGDTLLNWKRFEISPETHKALMEELTPSIPATMQVAAADMIRTLMSGKMEPLRSSIQNMMIQVGRHDAAGGVQMVDLAVSCLLPPIIREIDHPSTLYARHISLTRSEERPC